MLNRQDPYDKYHIVNLKEDFMWRNCHILVFEWLSINLVELLKQNNHVGESLDDTRIIGTVQLRTVMWGYFLNCPNYSQLPIIRLVLINATGPVFYNSTYNRKSSTKISDENEQYSNPSQLRYPQLSYFRRNAILNWVQKNLS